jgi:hypothetical protein
MSLKVQGLYVARDMRFSLLQNVHTDSGALLFRDYLVSFLGLNCLRCEVDHSSPSSAKVKKEWNSMSAPPICFYAVGGTTLHFT